MPKVNKKLKKIKEQIILDCDNLAFTNKGWKPIYIADSNSRIALVGQAPGIHAQTTGIAWNDQSGKRLRSWLGVSDEDFYNPHIFAIIPMDFYYPGKAKSGDMPPRKDFASKWHPLIFKHLHNLELIVLIGSYAQKYYLGNRGYKTLTKNVEHYAEFLPKFFPIPHPSPINIRWMKQNPWFEERVVPILQLKISNTIYNNKG